MRSESNIRQKLALIERITGDEEAAGELGFVTWGKLQVTADALHWALADEVPTSFRALLDTVEKSAAHNTN